MNPRVDLTGCTAPGPVTLRLSMPVSSPGRGACEFQSNINIKTEIYVLKPVCVYSSLLLRCFIHPNISFGIIYNFKFNTKARRFKIGFAPPGDRFEVRACPNLA